MIILYQCNWTNDWVAYDSDYEDEFTPHGWGVTPEEALGELIETMDDFFGDKEIVAQWLVDVEMEKKNAKQ